MAKNNPIPPQPYVYTGVYGLVTNPADLTDKEEGVKLYVTMALCRTQSMFIYENLPETIPQRSLELYIQTGGSCCIAKHNGELYAFFGTMGGEPNEYYMPTEYIVANPYLNMSERFKIHEDCVVFPNDAMYMGLMPLFRRYATQMVENDITMFITDINSRIASLLTGNTDRDIASAQEYIQKIYKGELGIAMSTPFMEGLKTQPYGEHNSKLLTDLIELQQYYKASMFNDLGLNANYNMKRETIVSAEIEMNADALFPFVDNMYYCRKLAVEEVNKLFGTNIEVHLNSSWEELNNGREVTQIIAEAEALSAIGGQASSSGFGDSSQLEGDGDGDGVPNEESSSGDGLSNEDTDTGNDNSELVKEDVNEKNDENQDNSGSEENAQFTPEVDQDPETEEVKDILAERLLDAVQEHDPLDEEDSSQLEEVKEEDDAPEENPEEVSEQSDTKLDDRERDNGDTDD